MGKAEGWALALEVMYFSIACIASAARAVLQLLYPETATAKWLFLFWDPQRQVSVAGVEEEATLHRAGKGT
jgi:hypothetical protein